MDGDAIQQTVLTGSAVPKATHKNWFVAEIQQMMYGFGDCRKPLQKSATLIEEIVRQQMAVLLYKAEDVGRLRGVKTIGLEDILFLFRNNKVKLRRLLRYLVIKDLKGAIAQGAQVEGDEQTDGDDIKSSSKKRYKICYDFLKSIDQTGELVSLLNDDSIDEIKQERALRAELCAQSLNAQKYLEFTEARQASFAPKYKIQKFRDWLMSYVTLELKLSPFVFEVFSYLAYETVAQIMDLALLLRRDSEARSGDPLSLVIAPVCMSHDPPLLPAPSSPQQPPPSIASPPIATSPSLPTEGTPSEEAEKANPRKKRKMSLAVTKDELNMKPITPEEIRDAVHRFSLSCGPFADFSKCPLTSSSNILLCL